MGPAGTPFMWLTVLLLVAALVSTVLLWPKLAGRTPLHFAGRTGLVVTGQLFAALAALIIVNKTLGPFYVTWADLFGQDVGQVSPGTASGPNSGGPGPGGGKTAPGGGGHSGVPHNGTQQFESYSGRFVKTDFAGPKSGVTGEVDVYTPPQYDDPANKDREFPVVMLLHGIPGTNSGWVGDKAMNVQKQVEPLVASGKIQPFILVVADIGNNSNNTQCSDVPGKGNRGTWLADDVRTMVIGNFRAASDPKQWATLGYSTGGTCAIKLAVQHPQAFHYGMSMAADDYKGDGSAFKGDNDLRNKNSALWLLQHQKPAPDVSLWLMTSKEDEVGQTRFSDELIQAAKEAGVQAEAFTVPRGGHVTATWRQLVEPAFVWLNGKMQQGR
ncbi:alpha/beta hydrolase [Yinghuangia seranimata]|uniref:alpha/beta hydrolase n=1 Tax=Yinghuangia seranimata TaxID=408067 RepID=UPI00248B3DB5|nr:alpha/beta hydrolase-fold protein [Yinghuangia seranimata]MDI2126844.1 alpha/beta hydrolase-fold protein [Yinghuangia seranimata]